MDKKKWIEVFAAAGIDEAARNRWHRVFEEREPKGHQAFLEWLGLPPDEVKRIRALDDR
jgi:hypothetical protein